MPNSSFEELVGCPNNSGQIQAAEQWINVLGSVDYYNECGTNGYGIPVNKVGGGYANSGEAYIGLSIRSIYNPLYREFAGTALNFSLIPGKTYNVELHVSFADSCWYATKNVGAYFSAGQPTADSDILLSYEPQVKYAGEAFLTNKEGWTKIEGSFIANGGENFISLGNFDSNEETDTLFVEGGGVFRPAQPYYWTDAYYFIDDVSVTLDTLTGINELENVSIEVYPNPAKNEIFVSITGNQDGNMIFELWDMLGQNAKSVTLKPGMNVINTTELSVGVYHYIVKIKDETKQTGKQVIIE